MKEKTSYGRIKKTTIGGFAMSGKKGMKHYPSCIKEQAVHMHLEEHKTTTEIMETLGIHDRWRIWKWCETYRKYGTVDLPSTKPKGRPRKHERTAQQQLEYEMKHLKMENELLRNFLYEAARR